MPPAASSGGAGRPSGIIIEAIWRKLSPKSADNIIVPLSSGFIAGEAILAVLIPVLMVLNLLPE